MSEGCDGLVITDDNFNTSVRRWYQSRSRSVSQYSQLHSYLYGYLLRGIAALGRQSEGSVLGSFVLDVISHVVIFVMNCTPEE